MIALVNVNVSEIPVQNTYCDFKCKSKKILAKLNADGYEYFFVIDGVSYLKYLNF